MCRKIFFGTQKMAQTIDTSTFIEGGEIMTQWQINRAGLLSFWYYDEEIFEFADGKLLFQLLLQLMNQLLYQLLPILLLRLFDSHY